jgi:hypothetical protein
MNLFFNDTNLFLYFHFSLHGARFIVSSGMIGYVRVGYLHSPQFT